MNKLLNNLSVHKFRKGFTLIELLVVISIIGILVAVGATSYQRAVKLSRDSKRKTDLEQIRQALETYRSEVGIYPAAGSNTWKTALENGYITTVPEDPKAPTKVYYYANPTSTTYALCATLEVPPVPAMTVTNCDTGNNYKVANP